MICTYQRFQEFKQLAQAYLQQQEGKESRLNKVIEIVLRKTKNLVDVEECEDAINLARNKYVSKDEKKLIIVKDGQNQFTEEDLNKLNAELKAIQKRVINLSLVVNPKYFVPLKDLPPLSYQFKEAFRGFVIEDDLEAELKAYDTTPVEADTTPQ